VEKKPESLGRPPRLAALFRVHGVVMCRGCAERLKRRTKAQDAVTKLLGFLKEKDASETLEFQAIVLKALQAQQRKGTTADVRSGTRELSGEGRRDRSY
jgi:hypothetical protein